MSSLTLKKSFFFTLLLSLSLIIISPCHAGENKTEKKASPLRITIQLATSTLVYYCYVAYAEPRLLEMTKDQALKTTLKEVGKLLFLKEISNPIADAGKYLYSLVKGILDAPADILAPL